MRCLDRLVFVPVAFMAGREFEDREGSEKEIGKRKVL